MDPSFGYAPNGAGPIEAALAWSAAVPDTANVGECDSETYTKLHLTCIDGDTSAFTFTADGAGCGLFIAEASCFYPVFIQVSTSNAGEVAACQTALNELTTADPLAACVASPPP